MPAGKECLMLVPILALLATITLIVISEKDVASQLTRDISKLGILKFDDQTAYIKLQTHWQKIGKTDLLEVIRNLIVPEDRYRVKSKDIAEVAKRLSEDISLKIDIEGAYKKQQYLINFLNGVYNTLTDEFTTDRNNWIFNYVIDANYVENCSEKDCPNFMRFIITSAGVENKDCIFISTGFGISSLTDVKRAIFLTGESDGGKSTLLRFIESAVAPELVSNISFQQLADRHYIIQLLGKKLNISYDNSAKAMDNEQIFKSVCSCEKIEGRALRENPVRFTPTAKLFFASNKPYVFKHPDLALYNRMTVIPFEYSIPPKEQDKQLLEKLMAERDVVFSLAAKSLKGFIESGYDFKMSAKGKAYLENRIVSLHSVEEFLDEKTVVDEKGSVVGEILYEMLKEWCKGNMQTPVNSSEFKERVIAYAPNIEPKKVGDKRHRRAGFKGIRLKTAEELNAPDDNKE
ncbi:MAG TPA: phage/plasmid primase, P4 family [Ruminococcus sp.]|nr:phage/plasmid primase, P4 family [Ruminococcus sp.]